MALTIEDRWPLLNDNMRAWIVNNLFSPLAPYTLSEIERLGGPGADDEYWKAEADGSRGLPAEAITWITRSSHCSALIRPRDPDPRAACFKRSWPRR